jgi:NAD(P)H-hydrate epimerase
MTRLPVLNAAQAAEWDERARTEARMPSRVLMEAAGRAVAQVAAARFPEAVRRGVLVAAGHGNNGGDGWVAARALRAVGVRVWVAEVDKARSPDCDANRTLALKDGVELLPPDTAWPLPGVTLDALLGTGASGAPRGPIGELAKRLAALPAPLVAVDGPTGLDLSTGAAHGPVRATLTVTFGGARRGHLLAREWSGTIVVADIGFPPPDPAWPVLFDDRAAAARLPPIEPAMHKGDRGRVLVIGGADGMAGAALHAASAALAAGAGLVRLAASEPTVRAVQASLPDALTTRTALGPDVEQELQEMLAWADAVVLGPGLGRGELRTRFACAVLAGCRVPAVVDADALHTGDAFSAGRAPRVLTPHPGEFRSAFPDLADRLTADRFAATQEAAERSRATVLLKGVPTVIASADAPSAVVAAGNPGLATGGSGDLLAGFIGAFLARGLAPPDAAALGALTLGRAADLAAPRTGVRSMRPADVIRALPEVWRALAAPPAPAPPVLLTLDPPWSA